METVKKVRTHLITFFLNTAIIFTLTENNLVVFHQVKNENVQGNLSNCRKSNGLHFNKICAFLASQEIYILIIVVT